MTTSGDGATGLVIQPRSLATPGSLTAWALESGPVPLASSLTGDTEPVRRQARLDASAFGVSGPEAARRLDAVLGGEGYLVSTGHQPILFLGPLYVLYKALTAVALAEHLERVLGAPVVPMFWIASDDHDWLEVGRTTVPDRGGELATLAISPPEGAERRSVGPHTFDDSIKDEVVRLAELLATSSFTICYLDHIRSAYRPGATATDAFSDLLRSVLGDRGYVWLDSAGEAVKRASAPFFQEMLSAPESVLTAWDEGARLVAEAGFDPAIARLEGGLPLFFDAGDGRRRVVWDGSGFRAGPDGTPETPEVWRGRLEDRPGDFSPNVSSRPPLESHLLPVAATVLGPGEIAYWSQLGPLFDAFETPFPAIQPRAAWTLIESRVQRLLDRVDVEVEGLADGGDQAASDLTRAGRPEAVDAALGELRRTVERGLGEVDQAVAEALPGLKSTVGKTRKGVLDALAQLSRKIDQETRRQLDTQIAQVRRAADNLFPDRKPQERVVSPFYHLSRYGPSLLDELAEETERWLASGLASIRPDG